LSLENSVELTHLKVLDAVCSRSIQIGKCWQAAFDI
jgi:hypothetical protein